VKVWVNGDLVEPADARVSVFDHGLTVGDGVFETCKVVDGTPFALTRHLDRLADSARAMELPDPDLSLVRRAVAETLAAASTLPLARLRITYTAGVAPLGSRRGEGPPTLVVAVAPQPPWPPSDAVAVVPWTRNERGATAGVKTVSYADNVIALAYARRRGADEAVFANTAGELCEGTGTNVFVVLDGRVVTPPLSSGCLAGVTRALLLEWCDIEERAIPIGALAEAEEVFLTSSTRDIQPVHAVDSRRLADVPGPLTQQILKVFVQRSREDPDPCQPLTSEEP
jgi:branched-chain amino acid aminotransferase